LPNETIDSIVALLKQLPEFEQISLYAAVHGYLGIIKAVFK
jgi:hypothetical protein